MRSPPRLALSPDPTRARSEHSEMVVAALDFELDSLIVPSGSNQPRISREVPPVPPDRAAALANLDRSAAVFRQLDSGCGVCRDCKVEGVAIRSGCPGAA